MKSRQPLARHFAVVFAGLVLTYLFLDAHAKWSPIHRWNRAFADASLDLMATSNEHAVRTLGGSVWKFVQGGAYALWILVVIHMGYFLFMHFLHFDRPLPDPNPLRWPFTGLAIAVMTLRSFATVRTWRQKRNDILQAVDRQ